MTLESYLVFVGASVVLCIVPGPDMMFLLTRSVAQGTKAGLMAALGINLGGYVHLAAAVLGLSAVLATSPYAFAVVKFAGAGYLIYLGVRTLVSETGPLPLNPDGPAGHGRSAVFWQGFVSDALNPKVAIFFVALLPQFVVAHGEHPTLQLLLLGVTVNVIALTINCCLALLSGRVTRALRQNDAIARWLHKAMGVVFITLGLSLAIEKPTLSLSGSRSMQSSSIAVSCVRAGSRLGQRPLPLFVRACPPPARTCRRRSTRRGRSPRRWPGLRSPERPRLAGSNRSDPAVARSVGLQPGLPQGPPGVLLPRHEPQPAIRPFGNPVAGEGAL